MPTAPGALTQQTWRDLVALHWPVPGEALRPLLPPRLTPAILDGYCRVTLAAFRVADVHVVPSLPLPPLPPFAQIELRTYAEDEQGRLGVWYLALAASSGAAATAARLAFGLGYETATIAIDADGREEVRIRVASRAARAEPVGCSIVVRAGAVTAPPPAGSLEAQLVTPDRAWSGTERGLAAIEIERDATALARGHVEELEETWLWSAGLTRPPAAPLVHVVRESRVAIHAPRPV